MVVNNAFQLYKVRACSAHSYSFDLLGFRRSIVDTYYKRDKVRYEIQRMFPDVRSSDDKRVQQCIRCSRLDHWIIKGKQWQCARSGCKGTTLYFYEKCGVALHPDCFTKFHANLD